MVSHLQTISYIVDYYYYEEMDRFGISNNSSNFAAIIA
jgi:hypothetical protein